MSEDLELQAKIDALQGRINRKKAGESDPNRRAPNASPYRPGNSWQQQRGTPYGVRRAAAPAYGQGRVRNRTLVVNSHGQLLNQAGEMPNATATGWVSKVDRHKQLINNSVYEQKTNERSKAIEETLKQKEKEREDRQKAKINRLIQGVPSQGPWAGQAASSKRIITVSDIQFEITEGGSKIVKILDPVNIAKPTPKRAIVGGVPFLRSKHGNLFRSGLVKIKRGRSGIKKSSEPCAIFSTTGSCSFGPQCRYTHDPSKVTICRDFLMNGKCPAGEACDLSHDPTSNRVPHCKHFMQGNCTNPKCRYAHVRVSAGAPVCRNFAVRGFCNKGSDCAEKHVHECPEYSNKGICRNTNCRLPHVDRAGQLRKMAATQKEDDEKDTEEEAMSDVESDEELVDDDDVDSDDMTEEIIPGKNNHELSQQVDYVHF